MASTKDYVILVLLGVLAITASVYFIINQNQVTHPTPKIADSETQELASKMILLMHWKFIQDSVKEVKSVPIQIEDENQIKEITPKLDFMSSEFKRHSDNIKKTDIVEKYRPIKEKMIEYADILVSSLNHISQGYSELDDNKIQLSIDELAKAKEIENEITNIISGW